MMISQSVLDAAHEILSQIDDPGLDAARIAAIIEDHLGSSEAIGALRRCDRALEQLGVSVNEREFVLKAIAKLEGSQSTMPADVVIGNAP